MSLLPDESPPRSLKAQLAPHDLKTVPETGPTVALLVLAAFALACGGAKTARPAASIAPAPPAADRMIVRSGVLVVSVDAESIEGTAREVERLVTEVGGLVERANIDKDAKASLQCRVPAAQLKQIMDRVADLGEEKRRAVSAVDITEQYTDLEARLRNSVALRGGAARSSTW